MKLVSYSEALKLGKEKLKEALIPVRVNKAKKQAELEMCTLEEKIAVKEAALHEECCKEELDFAKIIELQDNIGLLERKRTQYKKILEEMFPAK
jgi:hypothetical protein